MRGAEDFDRAVAFYDAVLPVLGLVLRFRDPAAGWAGWQTPGVARPLFLRAPGARPHYHANDYGAYSRDPEGNKLFVCCHQPEASP